MFVKFILAFLMISHALTVDPIRVGSYVKDSFQKNDAKIDRAFRIVRDEILTKSEGNNDIAVLPVAVYHQIVNGINYKIITGIKDNKNLKVELAHGIVYSGPFGEDFKTQKPTLTLLETLPSDNNLTLEETTLISLQGSISDVLKLTDTTLSKVHKVFSYPNLVYDESYYIVSAQTVKENVTKDKFFIMSQEKGKVAEVITQVEFKQ
jgi:hypothetical protein